jgi:hypothetical protein
VRESRASYKGQNSSQAQSRQRQNALMGRSSFQGNEFTLLRQERRVRRTIAALIVGTLIACSSGGGSTDSPTTAPKTLAAEDLVGSWQLSKPAATACSGAAGAATYYFPIRSASALADGSVNVVESWDVQQPNRFNWSVTGNINIKSGVVQLNFWQSTLSVGEQFDGTISSSGAITGTIRDPKPGFSPHWVIGSCTWSMSGSRVGA